MATTTNALNGLLFIRDGYETARWNFPDAVGSAYTNPVGIGRAVSLTYSFLSSVPPYDAVSAFQAFTAAQVTATRQVLGSIAEVANVRFTETTGIGQLTFASSAQGAGWAGYSYAPSYSYRYTASGTITEVEEDEWSGDVWLNHQADWSSTDWVRGGQGYVTLLHEIGHALGLKHPFEADSASGYVLATALDNEVHTVMSYTEAPKSTLLKVTGTATSYSWQEYTLSPSTLMPLDLEALQYLYGANTSTRTGNNTYQWGVNAEILETIWDAGGVDTIDASNQTLASIINLTAGSYSSIALRQTDAQKRLALDLPSWFTQPLPADLYDGSNNLAIAKGVTIENANGGSGADRITGNAVNNRLSGGAGNDVLNGNGGNDILLGGNGYDILNGGPGNDVLRGGTGNDVLTGGAGRDLFRLDAALSATTNIDRIKDFNPTDDTVQLENAIFAKFGIATTGTINAAYFRANTTGLAADSNDYIVYETDTGKLFYDSNGNVAGGSVQIAVLGTNLALTYADFVLV